jgi:uncharacterized protein (DUF488 family)
MTETMQLLTFGHGTASQEEIIALLHGAHVKSLVDVRTAPGSRRNPHVGRDALQQWLPEAGIAYRWEKDLGGFRKPAPDSPDVGWTNPSFRGYAGYARTTEFVTAIDRVLAEAADQLTVVMCSESVWWRCHRRIIADFVVMARGGVVRHLMHDGRLTDHRPTEAARLTDDGLLVYDAGTLG